MAGQYQTRKSEDPHSILINQYQLSPKHRDGGYQPKMDYSMPKKGKADMQTPEKVRFCSQNASQSLNARAQSRRPL